MTIIHTVLTTGEVNRLSQRDNDYFKRRLEDNCMLSRILNKPVNRPLLAELQCVLDRQPIPRRKTEQHMRASKVKVFNASGVLIRIEHANGKVMRMIEGGLA